MNCTYKCLILFLGVNVIFGIGCFVLWETNGLINFEAGFLSFLLVLYSAYLSLTKKLKKELKDAQKMQDFTEEAPTQEEEENKKSKTKFNFSNFILGLQLSMGFFRIFAYAVLIALLVFLMHKDIFLMIPYIIGIGICLSSIVTLKYLSEKNHPN